jgi:hypothetical protein
VRIPRFRGDLPQRRHYRPSGLVPGRAKRLPHGGISLGHCRWRARGSFPVSASAAKSWPQFRHRTVWVWAWTNSGNCPSSVLRPAARTSASVGGGHVLAPWRSTLIFGCASAPTAVSANVFLMLVCRTHPQAASRIGRAHVRFAGGPGALCWGAARQKILHRRHSPACLSTISPKPGITSRPCRPICVIREPSRADRW